MTQEPPLNNHPQHLPLAELGQSFCSPQQSSGGLFHLALLWGQASFSDTWGLLISVMNGWIFPSCAHSSSLSCGIIRRLCHLLPKCLSEVQTRSLSLLELCAASKALTLASTVFLLISSDLASRRDDLNQCSEARIPGNVSPQKEGVWPVWLGKLRLWVGGGRTGWERWWRCLLGWTWRRFPHSRDLLSSRSRADVLVVEELKELDLGGVAVVG